MYVSVYVYVLDFLYFSFTFISFFLGLYLYCLFFPLYSCYNTMQIVKSGIEISIVSFKARYCIYYSQSIH